MTAPAEGSRVLRSRVPDPENESRGTIQRFFLAAAFFAGAFFAFFAGAFFAALAILFLRRFSVLPESARVQKICA